MNREVSLVADVTIDGITKRNICVTVETLPVKTKEFEKHGIIRRVPYGQQKVLINITGFLEQEEPL